MINIAIIGYGHWGKNLFKTFEGLPDVNVKYICDNNPKAIDSFNHIHTLKINDINQILKDDLLQAVVIATPTNTHYEIAKQCLQQGKHVLVEKPLALTVKKCGILINLARVQINANLMVGHTFLYNDSVRKIKESIDAGLLGDIYYIDCTRNHLGLIRDDVSVLWDLVPHDISICNYLLDDTPQSVNAIGSNIMWPDKTDIVRCALHYKDGVKAFIGASWLDTNKERTIKVVGSEEKIVFDDLNMLEPIRIFKKGIALNLDGNTIVRDGDIISPNFKRTEPLLNECNEFINSIKHTRQPFTDGNNGLEVVKVLSALDESLKNKGTEITLG